jgi:hypothetical protein
VSDDDARVVVAFVFVVVGGRGGGPVCVGAVEVTDADAARDDVAGAAAAN